MTAGGGGVVVVEGAVDGGHAGVHLHLQNQVRRALRQRVSSHVVVPGFLKLAEAHEGVTETEVQVAVGVVADSRKQRD